MEDKSISEDTGIPGPCVPVTAAVRHIGNVVIIECWVLIWILAKDGVRVVIIKIKMGISGSSAVRVIILASVLTAHTTLRNQINKCCGAFLIFSCESSSSISYNLALSVCLSEMATCEISYYMH